MALRRYWRKLTDYEFEVDWSAISFAAVGDVFRSLLEDLAGLPPRPDTLHNHRFPWWHPSHVNVNHFYIYSQSHQSSSFLIRGIIYDMGALIIPQSPKPYTKSGNIGLDERKDWSNVVHGYSMEQKNVDVFKADATEVLDRLGLKDVVGLKEKIDSGKQVNMRQLKLAKKQELEEIMGKGDSIRVKYMDRIMQKKMAAEARREQAKLGSVPTTLPPKDGSGLHAMPGSPALVRYLQERGLSQALLAHGTEDDLRMLLDQLGNFPFEDLKYIQSMKENAVPGEALRCISKKC